MKTIITVAAAVTMAVAGCQNTAVDPAVALEAQAAQERALIAEGWQPLDRTGAVSAYADATHTGTDDKNGPWAVYFAGDGSMRGMSGQYTDTGTYTISEDGVFCRTFTKWMDGQQGCSKVYQRGNQLTAVTVSGNTTNGLVATFEPGNTRSL